MGSEKIARRSQTICSFPKAVTLKYCRPLSWRVATSCSPNFHFDQHVPIWEKANPPKFRSSQSLTTMTLTKWRGDTDLSSAVQFHPVEYSIEGLLLQDGNDEVPGRLGCQCTRSTSTRRPQDIQGHQLPCRIMSHPLEISGFGFQPWRNVSISLELRPNVGHHHVVSSDD